MSSALTRFGWLTFVTSVVRNRCLLTLATSTLVCGVHAAAPLKKAATISLDPAGVLVVDGEKRFPLNLTVVPGPEAKAPNGRSAYAEFADCGIMFMRSGAAHWHEQEIAAEKRKQEAAATAGMRCCPWLGWDLSNFDPGNQGREAMLRKVVAAFKDSPGMGLWKAADEPDWGNSHNRTNSTPEQVAHVAQLLHQLDRKHPIWLIQAPRGSVASLKRYDAGWDVGGIDIYPVSYPPGVHSEEKNKQLSMVGDFTRMMRDVAGEKPFWMTLQIAFSGVVNPGRTLKFPTFPEQRFMAYEAIINGARGLTWYGGGLPQTLNDRDKPLGFNWTYFDRVMRPILEELGPKSPILPALLAPKSNIELTVRTENPAKRVVATKEQEQHVKPSQPAKYVQDEVASDASAMEWLVRESGNDIYVLACKKEGPTIHVRFSGLPTTINGKGVGSVLFEEPRKVDAKDGTFADWFSPFEVHVYKFNK